ncbi:MAG: beta-N-acetylhexosaminidase [Flavobacteriales bacterium]|nr:MAG: beta-N-acetylhexosaminidase [Flavobacteriales bacterium]
MFAQSDENMGIIPAPASIKKASGQFVLDKGVVLVSADAVNAKNADLLHAFIVSKGGFALRTEKSVTKGQKAIVITSVGADQLPAEGYLININANEIRVVGKDAGLFYAVQSLMQLMPEKKNDKIFIQSANIKDYPRFGYRGLHLDVARHFYPVSFVKKYIDRMAAYKLNTFHWHLTDDQGWRIEIKKYPKLTTIGASRNGTIVGNYPGTGGTDEVPYKGHYTQEEIKEVVAYAATKYITVVPEIEMPGHASAAIAAYPELSCFPERDTWVGENAPWSGSRKGKQVQQTWGVFDDVFVPTENTFKFLEGVLDEVIALFPSKYIHIGGDECPKAYWKESAFCQQLIKDLNLKDEHGLQSYFIQRMEKYLNGKGRSIIGWDEILEGGLAPNATVMAWRGENNAIEAANQHHDVIMTPGWAGYYFDHKSSGSADEPLTISGLGGGGTSFLKVYAYDPVPKGLAKAQHQYIKGVQGNVWSEYMESVEKVEYMVFPKLLALAEVAWSQLERKDSVSFSEERLPIHLAKFEQNAINYWVPTPIGQTAGVLNGATHTISLKVPVAGAKIYYTLDNYRPTEIGALYTGPVKVNVPEGKKKILKTVVITSSGKRSVVLETILNNGSVDFKTK